MASDQELMRARLLQLYLENAGLFGAGLEATTLRSESVQMRDVLAYGATHGTLTADELMTKVLQGEISSYSLDLSWLVRLAYSAALQNTTERDSEFAEKALVLAKDELLVPGAPKRFNKLLAELLFEQRRFDQLDALIAERPDIQRHYYNYISVDSHNPFIRSTKDRGSYQQWLNGFNRQFLRNGLHPVYLRRGREVPFNRLESLPEHGPNLPGPMVTVIMTSFKPKRDDILQSARSVLAQTWRNLELLIVDDASPEEYKDVLVELEALDDRVRVIRLNVNGGTYAARNVGIRAAKGEFTTGQDADDWSHPQRIQTQVSHLLRFPHRPGNQVFTVNMTEDLVRIRRGYSPFIPSAPTLMVRTHILRDLGGYLPARKAADNELRDRVSAYAGSEVYQIAEPLIFMRILPDSLSRSDFRPGWQHPARRAFWSSYRTWHAQAGRNQLRLSKHRRDPIYVPPRFTTPPREQSDLDFVFTADWCEYGETQILALEEIKILLARGYRVGVMHLENAVHLSEFSRSFIQPLQNLISERKIVSVLADEDFHRVCVMLVCGPELLQFVPVGRVSFGIQCVVVIADKPSWVNDNFYVHYLPEICARNSQAFLGRDPMWIARTAEIRRTLVGQVAANQVLDGVYENAIDPSAWRVRSSAPHGSRPVIGRWAGSRRGEWPASLEAIQRIWPTDGSADVRLYGDQRTVLRALGQRRLPVSWLCFQPQELNRTIYYRSLDFFVYYPSPTLLPREDRSVLEALAAGCIVVLPPAYRRVYGDVAVYAEPYEVSETIDHFMRDRRAYMSQSRRGSEYARIFGIEDYLSLMEELHATIAPQQEAATS